MHINFDTKLALKTLHELHFKNHNIILMHGTTYLCVAQCYSCNCQRMVTKPRYEFEPLTGRTMGGGVYVR